MTAMFSGTHDLKVDPKGRVSIPVEFRRVLLDGCIPDDKGRPVLVLGAGTADSGYLEGFSTQAIEALQAEIRTLKRSSQRRFLLEELYFGNVTNFQVDDNGRIVLPQALRDQIGLGEDARFVGYGDRFEIWNRATHQQVRGTPVSSFLKAKGLGYNPLALLDEDEEEGG